MKKPYYYLILLTFLCGMLELHSLSFESFFLRDCEDKSSENFEQEYKKFSTFAECLLQNMSRSYRVYREVQKKVFLGKKIFKEYANSFFVFEYVNKSVHSPNSDEEIQKALWNQGLIDFRKSLSEDKNLLKQYIEKVSSITDYYYDSCHFVFFGKQCEQMFQTTKMIGEYFHGKYLFTFIENAQSYFLEEDQDLEQLNTLTPKEIVNRDEMTYFFVPFSERKDFLKFLKKFYALASSKKYNFAEKISSHIMISVLCPYSEKNPISNPPEDPDYQNLLEYKDQRYFLAEMDYAYVDVSLFSNKHKQDLLCTDQIDQFYIERLCDNVQKEHAIFIAKSAIPDHFEELIVIADKFLEKHKNSRIFGIGNSPSWFIEALKGIADSKGYDTDLGSIPFSHPYYPVGKIVCRLGPEEMLQNASSPYDPPRVPVQTRPVLCFRANSLISFEYKNLLTAIEMDPDSIIEKYEKFNRKTVFMDYISTGESLCSFLSLLFSWAKEEGNEKRLRNSLNICSFSLFSNIPKCIVLEFDKKKRIVLPVEELPMSPFLSSSLAFPCEKGPLSDRLVPLYNYGKYGIKKINPKKMISSKRINKNKKMLNFRISEFLKLKYSS